MAKNDYFVIVYNILAYLYQCLKDGANINENDIKYDGYCCNGINKKYWSYIIKTLYQNELIEGISVKYYDDELQISGLRFCQITPLGIEYLMENSMLEKAKKYAKAVSEVFVAIK